MSFLRVVEALLPTSSNIQAAVSPVQMVDVDCEFYTFCTTCSSWEVMEIPNWKEILLPTTVSFLLLSVCVRVCLHNVRIDVAFNSSSKHFD